MKQASIIASPAIFKQSNFYRLGVSPNRGPALNELEPESSDHMAGSLPM